MILALFCFIHLPTAFAKQQAEVTPDQLEFRRQAVRRMIFDRSQDIRLAGLWPAKVVGLDVMHPPVGEQANSPKLEVDDGRLRISAQKAVTATRWIGGFNPFAVYDVTVNKFNGSGKIGLMFRDTDAENHITATLIVDDGTYPARYIALMMDRLNFPGMKGANWTYGAMYLYHAHPADGDQLDFEYNSR